ncbi:hypothetical protein GQ43DRAFT_59143 [Delitschia confertaspora ATCC 74209]|uniref:Uncharacterized protein n=1 Tax=Delitschia confertaspora ATCC 74209 TaxID=1513339 RepID=A0A9P4JXS0_9PLEO|nr:hypothetical protein GQ43DRAFT_59143 [Delitschia confertaspora ATCC 74209]
MIIQSSSCSGFAHHSNHLVADDPSSSFGWPPSRLMTRIRSPSLPSPLVHVPRTPQPEPGCGHHQRPKMPSPQPPKRHEASLSHDS